MSPEQTIWLLSMIGALLFIGVGFFGARASAVKEGPREEPFREETVREVIREVVREVPVVDDVELVQAREALQEQRAENQVLRSENKELSRAMEEIEHRDLDMELASARLKIADLERLKEENARLRAAAAESSSLRSELARLEKVHVDLTARAYAQPLEPTKELPGVPAVPGTFEKIVQEVARASRARSVAIADELGFTIAGMGAEHEGLAALCGLLGELERRAQMLLPVGAVRRITLEMDHGAGVSVCPIARSDTRIALATLTVGPRPDTVSLMGAVEKAGELLFR